MRTVLKISTMTTPKTQTAFGYVHGQKSIIRFDDLPVQEPGPNEVLLKIEAAGLCRSDFHILLAQDPKIPSRMVMGHEICGSVAKVGSNVRDRRYQEGKRFCLSISDSCGSCPECRSGNDNHCSSSRGAAYGLNQDGGFQEYLLVKNLRSMIPIQGGVSFEDAALATDAILTPFHAIMKVKEFLDPTTKILMFGAGGLGLNAIQIFKCFGCKIVCVDKRSDIESLAREFGASEFYTDVSEMKHQPESFDLCFDFVGAQPTVDGCVKYVKRLGKIVMVGLGRAKMTIPNYELARREVQIIFNFGGTSGEQAQILEWIRLRKIRPVVASVSMDEVPKYMDKMVRGELIGRIVFKPKL